MNEEMLQALYYKLGLQSKVDFETFKNDIIDNPEMQEAIYYKLNLQDKVDLNTFKNDLGANNLSSLTTYQKASPDMNYDLYIQSGSLLDSSIAKFIIGLIFLILSIFIVNKLSVILKIRTRNIIVRIVYVTILIFIALILSISTVVLLSNNNASHPNFTNRMFWFFASLIIGGFWGYRESLKRDTDGNLSKNVSANIKTTE